MCGLNPSKTGVLSSIANFGASVKSDVTGASTGFTSGSYCAYSTFMKASVAVAVASLSSGLLLF